MLLAGLVIAAGVASCNAGGPIQGDEPPTGPVAFLTPHFSKPVPCEEPDPDTSCRPFTVTNIGEASGAGSCTLFPREGSTAAFADGGTSAEVPDLAPGDAATIGVVTIGRGNDGEFWNPGTGCQPGAAWA